MNSGKQENGSAIEAETAELLRGLKRIEAPKDFNVRLRARIAQKAPGTGRSYALLLRFGLPIAALMLVAGSFYIGGIFVVDEGMEPEVAHVDTVDARPSAEGSTPQEAIAAADANTLEPVEKRSKIRTVEKNEKRQRTVRRGPSPTPELEQPAGGSVVRAGRVPETIRPQANRRDLVSKDPNATNVSGDRRFSLDEILKIMGIDAAYTEDSGWVVVHISKPSAASRSGIKPGDVIHAVNDQPIVNASTFAGGTSIRSVTVRRGDETKRLELKN